MILCKLMSYIHTHIYIYIYDEIGVHSIEILINYINPLYSFTKNRKMLVNDA